MVLQKNDFVYHFCHDHEKHFWIYHIFLTYTTNNFVLSVLGVSWNHQDQESELKEKEISKHLLSSLD